LSESTFSYPALIRELRSGKVELVYVFEGEEKYLRRAALNSLIDLAVDASVRDFNVSSFDLSDGLLEGPLAIAEQLPMMSERRVVILSGFEVITDERQLELLTAYVRKPVPTTILVFDTEALDNRRAITAILRKGAKNVSFRRLADDEATRWVREYANESGGKMEQGVAEALVGMAGNGLSRLSTEVDKLVAYAGDRPVTRSDVENIVRHTREHTSFELTDAILAGNRERAVRLLDRLLRSGDSEPVMILGAIARLFRQMLTARELMQRNAPNADVARAAGMSPWAVTKLNERVRRIDHERIVDAIRLIADADVALKTSLATPRLQLEVLVCQLANLAASHV
jgi:DNA polymerase III subunit delta